jgi:ribosomal-protein-alanine N-acetyltransferase
VTIRPATGDDTAAVAALDRALFGPDGWSDAQVEEEIVGAHRAAWVDEDGDGVSGYVMTRTVGDVADQQRIAVRPERRRAGLARALLAAALERARAEGAERMLLEVSAGNAGALAFYAAEGFVEIDRRRRYYRDGSDAVVMVHEASV